jgi:hypothetical protein
MSASSQIVIRPRGVGDFSDDLNDIAAAAREAAPGLEIIVEVPTPMEAGRRGVVWGEILNVTISAAGGYAFGKVADAIIARVREGWEKRRKEVARPRPRFVNVYGPHGEVIRRVRIPDEDAETDETG